MVDFYGDLVAVEWPWGTPDPHSRFGWDGTVAVPTDPSRLEWVQSPWRVEPPVGLGVGDVCQLVIRETACIVRAVDVFETPKDVGSLPRPTSALTLAFAELPPPLRRFVDHAAFELYFTDAGPVDASVVFAEAGADRP
ncbi:hypothetical protein KZZ52_13435 [Dactylosporangium sp. AC04546]|uniref:hypothetical protein n=1 Tax=Dactylosporangium sp. AC04546 TaxID=2862460 RepID=UPI001EE017CD|nr:hypothetical protein [Dactylosporangium sp. AC04546]WVK86330.1 hypothetical protein KZZ52_13435 [Dactylosporangium sp. AC04546]